MYSVVGASNRCRCARQYALDWLNSAATFGIAIGKTSAWQNELAPPAPNPFLDTVPQLFSVSAIRDISLVYSDATGDRVTPAGRYSAASPYSSLSALISSKATSVLIQTNIPIAALPSEYRVLAVVRDLELSGGAAPLVSEGDYVVAGEVFSYHLDWYATLTAETSASVTTFPINIIINF